MESTLQNAAFVAGKISPRAKTIIYWSVTALFCLQVGFTAYAQLRLPQVAEAFTHLGFPAYFRVELALAKFLGILLLVAPVPARLKEWAYAGIFFNFYGAVAAHLFLGDGPNRWAYPLFLSAVTLVSWALRPADRRLPDAKPSSRTRPVDWAFPAAIILILLVLSYLTLPTGRGGY